MTIEWTSQQRRAIGHRTGEAIVAASAGSGKTAVLIERAMQLVRSRAANVDELLIVTFTDDAAAQLTERLRSALEQAYRAAPAGQQRRYLFDQLRRLDCAQISTIHAFARRILREYHHLIALGAEIRVFSPEEARLLKHRVLESLFENSYAANDDFGREFRNLVARCGRRSVDGALGDAVVATHGFLATLAKPDEWLDRARRIYADVTDESFDPLTHPIWQTLRDQWQAALRAIDAQLIELIEDARALSLDKPVDHLDWLRDVVDTIISHLAKGELDEAVGALPETMPRSPSVANPRGDPQVDLFKKRLKNTKDALKKTFGDYGEALSAEGRERMRRQGPLVDTFLGLVERFRSQLTAAKTELGRLEFDDLQCLALTVLSCAAHAGPGAATVAEAYRRQFKFVMVDEYQDVNELQDSIIRAVCRESDKVSCVENLLVVGDIKQSIYRFRLAEPRIFQRLCRSKYVGRIDLQENFRSRRQIIDTVNTVFEHLLVGGATELTYDDRSKLICAADYEPPASEESANTELLLLQRHVESDTDDELRSILDLESVEREAYMVAERIKTLIQSGLMIQTEQGRHKVREDDVVILLRSLKFTARTFVAMLRRCGLQAHCEQVEAFLEYPEIADVLALLEIVDNPYQDIPLVTVLRSPMMGFDADDLARVRCAKAGPFYRAMKSFHENGGEKNTTRSKVDRFQTLLKTFRQAASELTVSELLQRIYHDTGCLHLARIINGEHAQDNLHQFLDLADRFARDGKNDLTDFLQYLDLLRETHQPISSVHAGTGAGVTVMSIHAAKGLEFPVVILANLAKKTNLQDLRENVLVDRELTIGMKTDETQAVGAQTPATIAIQREEYNKTMAEELRLLYVAMTRAREKLILSAAADFGRLARLATSSGERDASPERIVGHTTPCDWLTMGWAHLDDDGRLASLLESDEVGEARVGAMTIHTFPESAQRQWRYPTLTVAKKLTSPAEQIVRAARDGKRISPKSDNVDGRRVLDQLEWRYRHHTSSDVAAKFAVTELARCLAETGDEVDPADQSHSGLIHVDRRLSLPDLDDGDGTVRGLVWHRFMERLDLSKAAGRCDLERQLDEMIRHGLIDPQHKTLIDLKSAVHFFKTAPGRIMMDNVDRLYRELRFTCALPAKDLPESLVPRTIDEPVLIQGTIDCLVETDDGWVIIDYKTDDIRAKDVDERTQRHRRQINTYGQAMGKILEARVASKWLYFTQPNSAVEVS